MSTYMGDLSGYYGLTTSNNDRYGSTKVPGTDVSISESSDNSALSMTDFLTLMVAQFQNQSMDSTADTADMLNQMVQMSVVQAITEISEKINTMTDASVMSYASSLVGKEVTLGSYSANGTLEEVVGVITGTGVVNGEQVVFVGDDTYYLNEVMAVGRLPELKKPDDSGSDGADDAAGGADGTPGSTDGTPEENAPVEGETPEENVPVEGGADAGNESGAESDSYAEGGETAPEVI